MATITVPVPEGFPLFGWDEQSIKSYCDQKPVQKGDVMIIYNGQAGIHEYLLAVVENPSSGKQRRVILSKTPAWGGASFYRTGKNCFSPKGQSKMLPPVAALMKHLTLNCDVTLDARYSIPNFSFNSGAPKSE